MLLMGCAEYTQCTWTWCMSAYHLHYCLTPLVAQAWVLLALGLQSSLVWPVAQLQRPPPALPNALHLPAQPWCACCALLAGVCWAQGLGAAGGGPPALLGASRLQAGYPCVCPAAPRTAAGHSLLS
ncbi:hypothetical protein HaLaN_07334 [Haematococcus lacustris]|uniref:Uncharacterized protein n=1 Tax=Haematococcus lacustris TaxID=44745 RepID=A0A699YVZ3_HAELA|nr:hypothetical protein HaLaN_07334 [Haematococcus lacustris]